MHVLPSGQCSVDAVCQQEQQQQQQQQRFSLMLDKMYATASPWVCDRK
jgi:hypothetical protein